MYERQRVECAFTSPVSMESVMLVMCSMQYGMSASSVAWCGDTVSRGGIYKFAMVRCLFLFMWILISCSSVLCVLMFLGMSKWVNVMLCLMYVSGHSS